MLKRTLMMMIGVSCAASMAVGGTQLTPLTVRPGFHMGGKIKMPDLIPVVTNVNQGSVQVRNIGNATAGASKLFVVCSVLSGGRSIPCATGLHLPNYDAAHNTLMYRIPALRPGARHGLRLFGPRALPRRPGIYGMKLFADGERRIAESNERNNVSRLDTVIRGKPIVHPKPRGKKPDLIPLLRGSNPFTGTVKVKNQGGATAGASKLVLTCKKIGHRGSGGGCADSPAVNRLYNPSLGGLVASVPALRPGQVYTVNLPFKGLKWAKGKYKFTFNADATRTVAESNERNNLKRTTRRR